MTRITPAPPPLGCALTGKERPTYIYKLHDPENGYGPQRKGNGFIGNPAKY